MLVLAFLISWTLYALMEVRRRETAAHAAKAEHATSTTPKAAASKTARGKASASKEAKPKAKNKRDADED